MISYLLCMTMPNNKEATFLRWFNTWSTPYHKLPQDQEDANMAVLVEQVVQNARKVVRFQNMIENYDIWHNKIHRLPHPKRWNGFERGSCSLPIRREANTRWPST